MRSPARSTPCFLVRRARALLVALLAAAPARSATAQATPRANADALAGWISLAPTPGYERLVTDRLRLSYHGWTVDRFGNAMKRVGSGAPHRVIACAADEAGYAVSEIRDDGWLRVQTAGNARRHPLWDQFHEGQRVLVLAELRGARRGVAGVFGVKSTHLQRRRAAPDAVAGPDDLWLDVGARTRADVDRLGIRILDPVVRDWPAWHYAGFTAGPDAAGRAGCEALVAASGARATAGGTTDFVVAAASTFNHQGLTGWLAGAGAIDTLVLLEGDAMRAATGSVAARAIQAPWESAGGLGAGSLPGVTVRAVATVALPVRFAGTLGESVADADLAALHASVARLAAVATPTAPGDLPPIQIAGDPLAPPGAGSDSLTRWARPLAALADLYAVSGHEGPVHDAVLAALPPWARALATTDTAGNIVLAMGPDRDTVAFVAHMDEIGFEVTRIARDGTVSLRMRGGGFLSLWEGQTALLHRAGDRQAPRRPGAACDPATQTTALKGVFLARDSVARKQPTELTAWFGLDSAALVAQGVAPGSAVTSFKCSTRLSDLRFTARAIDDRTGTAALISALDEIDPARLDHKVLFIWSVREEVGLEGARAAARQLRGTVQRVYAVDTFVSSDSPLESSRFADLPIGRGAIVRALDNSSATPPDETARVLAVAAAARIPMQVGTTNGGNDGAELARYGVVDIPLSWPARYSHSPVETIDLRDVRSLSRLIAAVAKAR